MLTKKRPALERQAEKRQIVLDFLSDESYSTAPVIGELLGLKRNAVYKTLKAMERDRLLVAEVVTGLGGSVTVWGLTPHGAGIRVRPEAAEIDLAYYTPGRVSESTIHHTLETQRVRLRLAAQGWTNWISGRQCYEKGDAKRWLKIPDAIYRNPDGQVIAIEIERHFKTSKRYAVILSNYLQMIRSEVEGIQKVLYITSDGMAAKLKRLIQEITEVPVQGKKVTLKPEHYARFEFVDISTVGATPRDVNG